MSAGWRSRPVISWVSFWIGLIGIGLMTLELGAQAQSPIPNPQSPPTAHTQPAAMGPDRVMLNALESLYEPVPFDHRAHAGMAEMWGGCTTCHHRSPDPTTRPAEAEVIHFKIQDAVVQVPACKSCHEVSGSAEDIRMPNLKGAYHRQCLNCHREWMHGNACVICHKPKGKLAAQPAPAPPPTVDDIVGRMHPPIPEPAEKTYKTRYTPVDGPNVLFRHKEHTAGFGLKCVNCHHDDNCSHCHAPGAESKTGTQGPMKPGKTWRASHAPCMSCHKKDRCQHCHYQDDGTPPPAFEHAMTGQQLDADHAKLTCIQCHSGGGGRAGQGLKVEAPPTCGGAACHKKNPAIAYPAQRPGPVVQASPALQPATQPVPRPTPGARRPTTQPATGVGIGR
jgi:hypothetical protein